MKKMAARSLADLVRMAEALGVAQKGTIALPMRILVDDFQRVLMTPQLWTRRFGASNAVFEFHMKEVPLVHSSGDLNQSTDDESVSRRNKSSRAVVGINGSYVCVGR